MVDDTIESCVVGYRGAGEKLFICALYRLHSDSIVNFSVKLLNILNSDSLADNFFCYNWIPQCKLIKTGFT
jgi:hypothetical protein